MKGEIIGFDPDTNTGAISGHDGNRYDFVRLDWRGSALPTRGTAVDFVSEGMHAREIYPAVARHAPAEGDTAQIVYILYLVGLAVGVTAVVGVVMAYVNRADAPEWVQTHYRFQIRTFWIGILYVLISLVTMIIVVGLFFAVFAFVWWIVRCVKGLKSLTQGVAYENPATWLW